MSEVSRRMCRWVAMLAAASVAVAACGGDDVERTAGETILVDGVEVFSAVRDAPGQSDGPSVLFLHGASFTAEVWIETGILESVAANGHRAVAVDLPGYGKTDSIDGDRGDFLKSLIAAIDTGTGIVVVSPSMSGTFSLDLLESDGASAMAGFVPVAPVGIADFAAEPPAIGGLPALVVWGANDDVVDIELGVVLANVLGVDSPTVIDDAGHAAYKDQPVEFVRLLDNFLDTIGA